MLDPRSSEAVLDSTLLSRLCRSGLLPLLPVFFARIHLPVEVLAESRRSPEAAELELELAQSQRYRECPDRDEILETYLAPDLHHGECAMVVQAQFHLARGVAVVAITDDARGYDLANALSIPVWRTGRLLVELKRALLIDEVAPYLDRLSAAGFRLTPAVRAAILKNAGEA